MDENDLALKFRLLSKPGYTTVEVSSSSQSQRKERKKERKEEQQQETEFFSHRVCACAAGVEASRMLASTL
jgi:hypothetical protein